MIYLIGLLFLLSWVAIIFGISSLYVLKNLYTRLLSAATIDTVASLTILVALLLISIDKFDYVIRFVLLIGFLLITNPISSHVNIRSAFLTGVKVKKIEASKKKGW
jgi:multicomponent Na+:H+ antiporter subunit G